VDLLVDRYNDIVNKRQERVGPPSLYKRAGKHKLFVEGRLREFHSRTEFSDLLWYSKFLIFHSGRLQQNMCEGGADKSSENNRVDGFISCGAQFARAISQTSWKFRTVFLNN